MPLLGLITHYFFGAAMFLVALFLILLVLVQRGRGGGLAGAFGGLGGQSAFGAKAGDLFTRITMVAATIWIILCMAAIKVLNSPTSKFSDMPSVTAPAGPEDQVAPEGAPDAGTSGGAAPAPPTGGEGSPGAPEGGN